MRKRLTFSLVAGGLMAAMLPGAAGAQTPMEAEGTTTFTGNLTCEFGQASPLSLPPCEIDEDAGTLTFTMLNPAAKTGTFEGVQVYDAAGVQNLADGSFTFSGLLFFSGTVEGCGAGTVFFEAEGQGAPDADGVVTFSVNSATVVPGGSLPVTGTLDESGTEVQNGDGSATLAYTGTYTCEDADEMAEAEEEVAEAKEEVEEEKEEAKEQASD